MKTALIMITMTIMIKVHVQGCSVAALDTPDGLLLPLGDYGVGKLRHYKNLIP